VVAAGDRVRVIAVSGAVKVSAPAQARQAGRVGDDIHVTNELSRQTVTARVIDAQTVEVVR
jgi:flagella basal body P-ring formation protein FlgA